MIDRCSSVASARAADRNVPLPGPAAHRREARGFAESCHHGHRHPDPERKPLPRGIRIRRGEPTVKDDGAPAYLPMSRTTDRVLRILLEGDLARLRAESVAESLGISCTTLRRRLRSDHTNYQFLLDRARQYRCERRLHDRWLPGKCLADELGYLEVNSFYRAFRRWTGVSYSAYRQARQ